MNGRRFRAIVIMGCLVAEASSPAWALRVKDGAGVELFRDNFEVAAATNWSWAAQSAGGSQGDLDPDNGDWPGWWHNIGEWCEYDVQVTSSTDDPAGGAFEGNNCLRIHRESGFAYTLAHLESFRTSGTVHAEYMFKAPSINYGIVMGLTGADDVEGTAGASVMVATRSNTEVDYYTPAGEWSFVGVHWEADTWQKWEIDLTFGPSGPETFTVTINGVQSPVRPARPGNGAVNYFFIRGGADGGTGYLDAVPEPVTVRGTVVLQGYVGDNTSVGARFEFRPVNGGDAIVRTAFLNPDGVFALDNITPGRYAVTVKSQGSLSVRREEVVVQANPTVLTEAFVLTNGDSNGDSCVSFGDFSTLQNNYGQRGGAAAIVTPRTTAHSVDGILSDGEWATLHSDPAPDKPTNGCVELARWGAEVRDGVLYGAFELDPAGPTVAEFDTYPTKQLWLGLWIDADPAAEPATGVASGDDQFAPPRAQDINIELGMDNGSLICNTADWNSLNFWGRNDDFNNRVPVTVNAAYQGHVVEFAVPVTQIINEIANTDGTTPANVWKIGARAAGHVGGEDYAGDITDLQSVTVFGIEGAVTLEAYLGDNATLAVSFEFVPAGGGDAVPRKVLLNADGTFRLDPVPAGTYNVTVKSGTSLSAVLNNVSVGPYLTDLGTVELKNADFNGDDQISFEDFSILQNHYGQRGQSVSPLASAVGGGCGMLGIGMLSLVGLIVPMLRVRQED